MFDKMINENNKMKKLNINMLLKKVINILK